MNYFARLLLKDSLIVLELCIQDKAQADDERRNNNESHYNTLPNINSKAFYPMLILLQLLPLFGAILSCPLLCRCDPAGSKSKGEMCKVSPLLFAITGYAPLDSCIYACVVVVIDSLKLWSKNLPFFAIFQKSRPYGNCGREKMA